MKMLALLPFLASACVSTSQEYIDCVAQKAVYMQRCTAIVRACDAVIEACMGNDDPMEFEPPFQ